MKCSFIVLIVVTLAGVALLPSVSKGMSTWIYYDNDNCSAYHWTTHNPEEEKNVLLAVKYTDIPASKLLAVKYYIVDNEYKDYIFRLRVMDTSWNTQYTNIYGPTVAGWNEIDLSSNMITVSEEFMVGIELFNKVQDDQDPQDYVFVPELCSDNSSSEGHSYSVVNYPSGSPNSYDYEHMIRAEIVRTTCSIEGDPALYVDFGEDTHDMVAGETYCWTVGPANFGFVSTNCSDSDTFCVHAWDAKGWAITAAPPLEDCYLLDPGYLWWQDICLTVPCEVEVCDYDTLYVYMTYCDATITCIGDCWPETPECEDPNWYSGNPYYSADTVIIHIVPTPPSLYILQDTIYCVATGQTAAYVPFTICNGDPCAGATAYGYTISCTELVGSICTGFPQGGTTDPIPGGECRNAYAIVDAGDADSGDEAALTIVAWDAATGTVYDTCVQIVWAIEPLPVPLFTTPVVTILAIAMILAVALILRRRVTNRA